MFCMNKTFDSQTCFSLMHFSYSLDNSYCFPPDQVNLFPFLSIMMT